MDLAKPGQIQELCGPNAILTFQEYLEDYAQGEDRIVGKKCIQEQLSMISNKMLQEETQKRLKEIENGRRDLFF